MSELYNANDMPLSNEPNKRAIQEKRLNGNVGPLIPGEKLFGRDHPVKEIDGYKLKPNCCYRVMHEQEYLQHVATGFIYGKNENDEQIIYTGDDGKIYTNNSGVDWFLGGACLRYGNIIIECPAYKEYFEPAIDNGNHLSFDPTIKHMKSSGFKHPVPMELVRVIKHPDIEIHLDDEIKR